MSDERVLFLYVFVNTLDIAEMAVHYFLGCLLCIYYINSITYCTFYLIN